MAFTFRKRIKLLPGVHLNVGKKGLSVSAGVRGLRVTRGGGRTTMSAGLPGTGIGVRRSVADVRTEARASPDAPPAAPSKAATATAWLLGLTLRVIAIMCALGALLVAIGMMSSASDTSAKAAIGPVILLALACFGLWVWGKKLMRRH